MKSWGGLLVGAIGLAVLDAILSRQQAASNVGGFLGGAGKLVDRFLSPTVPFFTPTTTTSSATTSAATAPSSATTAPPASSSPVPVYI